jgi:hypothetical protein
MIFLSSGQSPVRRDESVGSVIVIESEPFRQEIPKNREQMSSRDLVYGRQPQIATGHAEALELRHGPYLSHQTAGLELVFRVATRKFKGALGKFSKIVSIRRACGQCFQSMRRI